jgi:pimeloyl-ACP methyl ester carboxylesterase
MLGPPKPRRLDQPIAVSLEQLVPQSNVYRHLEAKLAADYQRLSPAPERFEEMLAALTALFAVAPDYSEEQLRGIPVPVLILDGAEEEMVAPDQPLRMAELIPGAELVIMPGTGHFAPYEQPAEFNRIVLEYLAS